VPVRTAKSAEHRERVPGRHPGPWLPERHRPQFIDILRRCRVAPIDLACEDKVRPRIVGRAVPFMASHRARAEMHGLAGGESFGDILDSGHRQAVEQAVVGEIEAIEVSTLGATTMICLPPIV